MDVDLIELGRRRPLVGVLGALRMLHARRWFRRYWAFGIGSGAHMLASGLIDAAREDAEGEWSA
jgi:hypothetical protein